MRVLRVQVLLGGSNNPTSRSPEAVDWIYACELPKERTPALEEGVAYIECVRTPAVPRYRVQCTLRQGVTGNASCKVLLMIFKTTE